MGIIQPMGDGVSHLKMNMQGKQGSGKTYTAVSIACGLHRLVKATLPIVCIDTEGGLRFHRGRIMDETGMAPMAVNTRKIDDLMAACHEIEEVGYPIVVIDSVTHFWQGLMESYKAGLAQRFNKSPDNVRLTIDDIGKIKDRWSPFSQWYVRAPVHVITCGRLGYEWDTVEDDRGNERLAKVGTKTKAETEFGHECDIGIEMDLVQDEHPDFAKAVEAGRVRKDASSVARGTIIKDRWDILMGRRIFNPTFEDILPLVSRLRPQSPTPIDTDPGVMEMTDDGRQQWRVEKAIVLDNIELSLARALPGATGKDKTAKLDLIDAAFGTLSWEEIKRMSLGDLRDMYPHIRDAANAVRADRGYIDDAIADLKAAHQRVFGPSEPVPADTGGDDGEKTAAELDTLLGGGDTGTIEGDGVDDTPEPA